MNDLIWILDDDTISHIPSHPFTLMQQHKSLRALHCMNDSSQVQVKSKSSQVYNMDWFNSIQVYSTVQYVSWHDMTCTFNPYEWTWHDDTTWTWRLTTRLDSTRKLYFHNNTVQLTKQYQRYNTIQLQQWEWYLGLDTNTNATVPTTHTHTRHNWYCYSIINNNKHTTTTLCHYLHIIIIYDVFVVVVVVIISLLRFLF